MTGAIEQVLAALNEAGVRYIVVGGVAVVLHGHLRVTADLDLVVQLASGNVLQAMRALAQLGYRPRAPVAAEQFADPALRESWLRDKGLTVFGLWSSMHPGLEVDIFVSEPFDFDSAYARAARVPLDTTSAIVVSLPDLIDLKLKAARAVDLADVDALRAISEASGP